MITSGIKDNGPKRCYDPDGVAQMRKVVVHTGDEARTGPKERTEGEEHIKRRKLPELRYMADTKHEVL
ncbi:MAG TPA: hypothetical protein VGO47_06245 [Chlamydiales bacterium]|nr:hypothetical protein [Chlamydiales bacterium]